jgi:hypothetical protein
MPVFFQLGKPLASDEPCGRGWGLTAVIEFGRSGVAAGRPGLGRASALALKGLIWRMLFNGFAVAWASANRRNSAASLSWV